MDNDLQKIEELSRDLVRNLKTLEALLSAQKIFFNGERLSISEACEKITDYDIQHGEFCDQTIMDLMKVLNVINSELL